MMNRKEFQQYIAETIKDYLPESYDKADITFKEVVKNNDNHLTGIMISKPGEVVVPNIYIENFWNEYQNGKDIDEIVGEIADMRIASEAPGIDDDILKHVMDYDSVKDKLQIRLCDTKENMERLSNMVHTEHSDFSATYHINLSENEESIGSIAVTPAMMEVWGVSVEQLHADALAADMDRNPVFADMMDLMEGMMFGREPENLLNSGAAPQVSGGGMYCLTNEAKMNGAGLLLQEDLMQQIGDIVGGNFYILPSSVHETLVVPETMDIDLKDLSNMVYEINRTEVSPEDRLSDHVQHYDKNSRVMENAEKRESRLEKEKAETKAAKKSIHERLGEKKEKSAAMKTDKSAGKTGPKKSNVEL